MAQPRPPAAPPPANPPPVTPPVSTDPSPVRPGAPRVAPVVAPETLPAIIREPSPTLADRPPASRIIPEARQLPPHQTKLDRITGHLAALSSDMQEWTELRIELVKRQVEGVQAQIERFQQYANAAGFFVPALALAISGIMFFLVAVAFGIGKLLGSLGWGFFVTSILLIALAGLLSWLGIRSVKKAQAAEAEARRLQRQQRQRTREDIAATERETATNAAV